MGYYQPYPYRPMYHVPVPFIQGYPVYPNPEMFQQFHESSPNDQSQNSNNTHKPNIPNNQNQKQDHNKK
jgi:hypothetical protein